jgi:glycosyltransferase involved in cell wall biosynthesis
LVVVGSGSEGQPLRNLTADLGLQDHVEFTGYISDQDLPAYLASSDIFVFHSLSETFGIVFAQAMAAGLPIVAARTSCVPDVVLDDNGLLFDPFDISGFADSVEAFMDSEARRQLVSGRNRIRAQTEFDWNRIAERYEHLLLSIQR